jgi:hypothetical protein
MTLADLIRDSSVAALATEGRYGEQDPYTLALGSAQGLGYPVPGSTADEGEAQRYEASRLGAQRLGMLPLVTNPLHEALLSWFAEGEGKPSMKRLQAGFRGTAAGAAPGSLGAILGALMADKAK